MLLKKCKVKSKSAKILWETVLKYQKLSLELVTKELPQNLKPLAEYFELELLTKKLSSKKTKAFEFHLILGFLNEKG